MYIMAKSRKMPSFFLSHHQSAWRPKEFYPSVDNKENLTSKREIERRPIESGNLRDLYSQFPTDPHSEQE